MRQTDSRRRSGTDSGRRREADRKRTRGADSGMEGLGGQTA